MENVIYANGFEEFVEGFKPCPSKIDGFDATKLDRIHHLEEI